MKVTTLILLFIAALASGCASYNTSPYGASVSNVEALKSSGIKPVAVNKFTAAEPGQMGIMCRAAGKVEVNTAFETYIQNALTDELKLAGLYDPNSSVKISGRLDEIGFSSGMSDGNWAFTLTVSNQKGTSYVTKSTSQFSGSFAAATACQQVAQAFGPAVQKLIRDMVANPKFKEVATQ